MTVALSKGSIRLGSFSPFEDGSTPGFRNSLFFFTSLRWIKFNKKWLLRYIRHLRFFEKFPLNRSDALDALSCLYSDYTTFPKFLIADNY